MVASDIQDFSHNRTKARAYFCYLFSKNIPNRLPSLSVDMIVPRLLKIKDDLGNCDGAYLLDYKGVQVTPTYTNKKSDDEDIGKIRADRAYYYRAVREGRCTITDPYPSLITGELAVTASQPIYDEDGDIKYVACLDMSLDEVLKISHQNSNDIFFAKLFKYSYATFAFALIAISMLLFFKGLTSFFIHEITPFHFKIKDVFEATILLTLALAIFDLAKTIIEEEVLGRIKDTSTSGTHKTMVKFIGSIIIALSIEALMLVFKFAITDPSQLLYSMYIVGGVGILLFGLAFYIKFTKEKRDSSMKQSIAIVDYNMGNLASVKNAFEKLGQQTTVESDPEKFKDYDKLILPGVGAFKDAMEHLQERNMVDSIKEYANRGNYMFGICLGMQLLFESSQEFGDNKGLGLIKGHVEAFDTSKFTEALKVPHMGWNRMFTKNHPLFNGLDEMHYLYFVHSYHAVCDDEKDIIGRTEYGYEFTSSVARDNVLGIQPHPEKSHENGLKILENFINL